MCDYFKYSFVGGGFSQLHEANRADPLPRWREPALFVFIFIVVSHSCPLQFTMTSKIILPFVQDWLLLCWLVYMCICVCVCEGESVIWVCWHACKPSLWLLICQKKKKKTAVNLFCSRQIQRDNYHRGLFCLASLGQETKHEMNSVASGWTSRVGLVPGHWFAYVVKLFLWDRHCNRDFSFIQFLPPDICALSNLNTNYAYSVLLICTRV